MTNQHIDANNLNEMEIDVIGEVMNISMGSAATAMSTILDKKVNITTPKIEVKKVEEFNFSYLEPVVGVLIKYVEGIRGSNMLLLREEDLKKILSHLLSIDPEEMQELDEISISALCEIMNQMMGSAASALATFLGRPVNISPPEVMDTTNLDSVKQIIAGDSGTLVSINFDLNIDGLVQSEFISAMEPNLAKDIISMSFGTNEVGFDAEQLETEGFSQDESQGLTQSEIEELLSAGTQGFTQDEPVFQESLMANEPPIQAPEFSQPATSQPSGHTIQRQEIQADPFQYRSLEMQSPAENPSGENNLDLIMSVPIQITVELGRTKKKIKDIAELTLGNIVELDRQAGDQVDVVANGKLIARGDVVVVDDNYSVRITEIIKAKESF